MSKYHSTVSRRNFMKALGLGAAGIGAAAAATPIYRDLAELSTSDKASYKRPWYIKENEFKKPSTEVDWSIFEWWDNGPAPIDVDPGADAARFTHIIGYEPRSDRERADLQYRFNINEAQGVIRETGLKSGKPGYALRDKALSTGLGFNNFGVPYFMMPFIPPKVQLFVPWTGDVVTTPEQLGVSKWTGTPEEATGMVRTASHHYGSYNIGVFELDSDTRKLAKPKRIRFADEDTAHDEDFNNTYGFRRVIPNKAKWAIAVAHSQSTEMTKRGPLSAQQLGSTHGYSTMYFPVHRTIRFIKALGYQAMEVGFSDIMNVAAGAISGVGELSRMTMQLTPEHGPNIRGCPVIVTDLPLAPTPPIDAGMFEFCKTCKICAEVCDENNGQTPLSLETEPTWEVQGPSNRTGVKAFQIAWGRCNFCPFCMSSCPFSRHNISPIHNIVTATTAITPIFNGFFTQMEHFFGYGMHDTDAYYNDFWERDINSKEWDPDFGGGRG